MRIGRAMASPNTSQESAADGALSTREKALVWKQDLRIVPLSAAIYLLCYLDRSNIGRWKRGSNWWRYLLTCSV